MYMTGISTSYNYITKPFPEMVIDWSSEKIIKKEASQCFDFKVFRRLEPFLELHDAYPTHATEVTEIMVEVTQMFLQCT